MAQSKLMGLGGMVAVGSGILLVAGELASFTRAHGRESVERHSDRVPRQVRARRG